MKRNISRSDRFVRMAIAVFMALLVLSNTVLGASAVVISIIAVYLFVTAFMGSCVVYTMLKISTVK